MLLSEEETSVAEEMMIGTRDLDPLGLMSALYHSCSAIYYYYYLNCVSDDLDL